MEATCFHGTEGALGDDDGFGDAVLHGTVVGVDEVLEEAEPELKGSRGVAESPFDRMPKAEVRVDERDDAYAEEALAGGSAFSEPGDDAEVEDGDGAVEEEVPPVFFEAEAEVDLDVRRDGQTKEFARLVPGERTEANDKHERDEREQEIDKKGEGSLREAGQLNSVQLLEPGGFASRKGAHGSIVCGSAGGSSGSPPSTGPPSPG